jgi:hypothetical protein
MKNEKKKVNLLTANFISGTVKSISIPKEKMPLINHNAKHCSIYCFPEPVDKLALNEMSHVMQFKLTELLNSMKANDNEDTFYRKAKTTLDKVFEDHTDIMKPDIKTVSANSYFKTCCFDKYAEPCNKESAETIEVDCIVTIHSEISDYELKELADALKPNRFFERVEVEGIFEYLFELRSICFVNEFCNSPL